MQRWKKYLRTFYLSNQMEAFFQQSEVPLTKEILDTPFVGGKTLLLHAVMFNKKWARELLKRGANTMVIYKKTYPLWQAIEHKHLEIVRLLVENGADPNLVGLNLTGDVMEGVVLAVFYDCPEIVDFLLQHGGVMSRVDTIIENMQSYEMFCVMERYLNRFNEEGKTLWEEHKLRLLMLPPQS